MGTGTAPPIDVVLEAPASVGLLLAWADEHQDQEMLQLIGRVLDAARSAGVQRLQGEGGWVVIRGRGYERDDLVLQCDRHYVAGEHVDVPRPHEHLYVSQHARSGEPVHRAMLPTAALNAQVGYGRAMARCFDDSGLDVASRTRTPAGWELAAVVDQAARLPRRVCRPNVPVAEQLVPTDRWDDPRAA